MALFIYPLRDLARATRGSIHLCTGYRPRRGHRGTRARANPERRVCHRDRQACLRVREALLASPPVAGSAQPALPLPPRVGLVCSAYMPRRSPALTRPSPVPRAHIPLASETFVRGRTPARGGRHNIDRAAAPERTSE